MTWGPIPVGSSGRTIIRSATLIDVDILGTMSVGTIRSNVTIEGTITAADIKGNWDGGSDLSGGADATATTGFFLDASAGAAQFQTIYAEGGELGNITLVGNIDLSHASSNNDGVLSIADQDEFRIQPPYDTGKQAPIMYLVSQDAAGGSSDPYWQVIPWGGTGPVVRIIGDATSASLQADDGLVGAPGFSFVNDIDTGLYRIGANNIGVAANGAKVVDISTAGVDITGTLGVSGTATMSGVNLDSSGIYGFGNYVKTYQVDTGTDYTPTASTTWEDFTSMSVTVTDPGVAVQVIAFATADIRNTAGNQYDSRMRIDIDGTAQKQALAFTLGAANQRSSIAAAGMRRFDPTGNFTVKVQVYTAEATPGNARFDEANLVVLVIPQ